MLDSFLENQIHSGMLEALKNTGVNNDNNCSTSQRSIQSPSLYTPSLFSLNAYNPLCESFTLGTW